jgi:hypothetical protein
MEQDRSLNYCSFAYSALASFRMGMSGSASVCWVARSIPGRVPDLRFADPAKKVCARLLAKYLIRRGT